MLLRPVTYTPVHYANIHDETLRPAYRDKPYMAFIVITMLFAACFFQIFTNLPVYFKKDLHLSEQYIGIIMSINGVLIAMLEMVLVYKLEGKKNKLVYLFIKINL